MLANGYGRTEPGDGGIEDAAQLLGKRVERRSGVRCRGEIGIDSESRWLSVPRKPSRPKAIAR